MIKNWARSFLPVILLAALSVPGWAQDAKSILNAAAKAMGTDNLKTLQYSGSGSSYDEKGQHLVLSSYVRQMDLNAATSNVRLTRMQGTPPAPHTVNQTIAADSPWNVQFDFWLTPYGFMKGAIASDAAAEIKTVDGSPYRIVSFTLPSSHKVAGYINAMNMVERVEVRIDNDVLIQGIYHSYEDFGGLKVPTIMVQKRSGELAQVLIVKDAKPNS